MIAITGATGQLGRLVIEQLKTRAPAESLVALVRDPAKAAALDALPEYHRGVILLREVDGLSYEEMAVVMGVSKGTIMSRLFHARQKLQKALADCYEERGGPSKAERRSHDADGEEPGDAQDEHDATDGGDSNGEEEGS